jgi:hypothetical protein
LLWHELHALCSLFCCDVEYNVIITFLHTHTQKKKLHLLCEACCRNKMGVLLHMVSESVRPTTWDHYGFGWYDLIIMLLIELTCVRIGNHG